jgi:hydrogenase small subunit
MMQRRDFLKVAAILGISYTLSRYSQDIRKVFALLPENKVHLIWLNAAADSGCTISMLQAYDPELMDAVSDLRLSADFWQPLMTPDYDLGWVSAGYTSEESSSVPLMRAAYEEAPVDVLVVEGSIQTASPKGGSPGDFCTIGEYQGKPRSAYELLQRLAAKASYVVAVGQCSAFGGIPAAMGNVTGATSVVNALKQAGVGTRNPVINLPGCPAHPDWTLLTLASVLQGFKPDLDPLGRPRAFFSEVIHDHCPRRGYYDRGEFATSFDDPRCLWKLGCKGPITYSACAITKWNSGLSFCTQRGPMCWGCMHESFPDPPSSPFFKEVEAVPSILGVDANALGAVMAVGTAAAVGAHLASSYRRGKFKRGGEEEARSEGGKA